MTLTHFALRRAPLYLATLLFVACSDPATDPVAVVPSLHHSGGGRHTVVVDPDGHHDATTIQGGIDLAPEGGTVRVLPGTYTEVLLINKGLTLEGASRGPDDDHARFGDHEGRAVIASPPGLPIATIQVATPNPVVISDFTVLVRGQNGIFAQGVFDVVLQRLRMVFEEKPAGAARLVRPVNTASQTGGQAHLIVRESFFDAQGLPVTLAISIAADVDAVIEHNVFRRTGNSCIFVNGQSTAINVDIVDNDLDECATTGANSSAIEVGPIEGSTTQATVGVVNIVGNRIRNSSGSCPPHTAIRYELYAGRIERNTISAAVQECAVASPLALPAAIWVGSLRGFSPASPVMRFNDIQGNAHAGLRIAPNITTSLDARCNYWGSEDGPSGVGSGTGDAVLVETGGARPVLAPFATQPIAHRRRNHSHHDRGGRESCRVKYSLWSTPVNPGPPINTTAGEFGGALSPDGLAMYFNSNRPGSAGTDLWFSRRACRECPWGPALNLGPTLNGPDAEGGAVFSPDGRLLFFHAIRPEGFGLRDIYVSRRDDPDDDFGWGPPVNLGPYVNTPTDEQSPSYFRGEQAGRATLYFSRGVNQTPAVDIYGVGLSRAGEALEPAVAIAELNEPNVQDQSAAVRDDGREVIFASTRAGGAGGTDFYFSTRRSIRDPWTKPEHLGAPLNTTGNEPYATLSRDGQVLLFLNARAGGVGMNDIWMSTRTRIGR